MPRTDFGGLTVLTCDRCGAKSTEGAFKTGGLSAGQCSTWYLGGMGGTVRRTGSLYLCAECAALFAAWLEVK